MTKEETLTYLKAYLDGDTAIGNIIPLRSVLESALEYLEPSLPSNLDEAAEKNFETMEVLEHENIFEETHNRIFKAGAEWMAGQGIVADFEVNKLTVRAWLTAADEDKFQKDIYDSFEAGDKVIVQIRKANE